MKDVEQIRLEHPNKVTENSKDANNLTFCQKKLQTFYPLVGALHHWEVLRWEAAACPWQDQVPHTRYNKTSYQVQQKLKTGTTKTHKRYNWTAWQVQKTHIRSKLSSCKVHRNSYQLQQSSCLHKTKKFGQKTGTLLSSVLFGRVVSCRNQGQPFCREKFQGLCCIFTGMGEKLLKLMRIKI